MSIFADIVFIVPSMTQKRVDIQSVFVDLK